MSALIGLAVLPACCVCHHRAARPHARPSAAYALFVTSSPSSPFRSAAVRSTRVLALLALTVALALRLALAGRTHHRLPASGGLAACSRASSPHSGAVAGDSFTVVHPGELVVLFVLVALSPVDGGPSVPETGLLIGGLGRLVRVGKPHGSCPR